MHRRSATLSLLILLAISASPLPEALAAHGANDRASPWQLARRGGTSLDAAVARIQRETGGRVLSATTVRENGRTIHRIKVLLPSGKVRVYHVDAGD